VPSGGQVAAPNQLDRVLRGYLDHLVVERGIADNTLRSYRRDLRRYSEYLGGRGITELAEVTELVVGEFLAVLREGNADHPPLATSSAARTLVAVRGLQPVRGPGRAAGHRRCP